MKSMSPSKSLLVGGCLSLAAIVLPGAAGASTVAAAPAASTPKAGTEQTGPDADPANCTQGMSELVGRMRNDGYWRFPSRDSYGYPAIGRGVAAGRDQAADSAPVPPRYSSMRTGYELRTLLASVHILANRGDYAACKALLGSTRALYSDYVDQIRADDVSPGTAAVANASRSAAVKSNDPSNPSWHAVDLIGTDVLDLDGAAIGIVHDVIVDPKSGGVGYLIVSYDTLFGVGGSFVPIPWPYFRATDGSNLLLGATRAELEGAPRAGKAQLSGTAGYDALGSKIDAYWKATLPR